MSQLTDEQLMNSVKEGALSHLSELFDRYHIVLYNFFLRLTGDRSASEDLTQNLFYRVLRYRHTFNDSNGRFKPWLYQLARNLHADYCKKERKAAEVLKHIEQSPDITENEEGYQEDDFEKLRTALGSLGPVNRELIVLSRFEGLKYAEIAQLKDISVGSVKVQVHRAIKELKNIYFNL